MKLFEHQREIIERNPKIHGLFFETGLGKTLTAIKLIEQNVDSCLIVCPKSLKENWGREIGKWSEKNIAWSIVTKEEFRRDWESLSRLNFEGVILDELHYFEGHKSQMHKNLMKYLTRVKPSCLYGLTATPMLASPYCVLALRKIFGKPIEWKKFTEYFFYRMKMGRRTIWQPRKDRDHELQELIRSVGTLRSAKECLDLPDKIFLREDFALTSDQKWQLKELDNDPTIIAPIVKFTAHHQIMGGTLKSKDLSLPTKASIRLLDYIKEHDKLVVVCRYNAELKMLQRLIMKHKTSAYILNGEVKDKQMTIDIFTKNPRAVLLVNAACSEGYNLKGVNTMIFYSLDYSLKNRVQMEGRIHGSGRGVEGEPSKYIDFVIPKSISEDVYDTIMRKTSFQIDLYAGPSTP